MLLATYQPKNWRESKREKYGMLEKEIGYNPIFCFSAEDIEGLIVQSFMAAPNYPEVLIMFETNTFDTLDIVLYNRYLINETSTDLLKSSINNKVDAKYHEYIVASIENIKKEIPLNDFFSIENLNAYEDLGKGADYNTIMQTFIISMANKEYAAIEIKSGENTTEKDIQIARRILMKDQFQKWLLPYVVKDNPLKILPGKYNDSAIVSDVTHELGNFYNQIMPEEYITYSNFDRMYDKIKSLLIPLDDMFESKKLFPNDRCWCGSGKKYKKCHGKYYA